MSLDRSATFKKALASNKLTRVVLKWIDRENYEVLKNEVKREKAQRGFRNYQWPGETLRGRPAGGMTFRHSGNAGDIIYALPAIRALSAGDAKLKLSIGTPMRDLSVKHPSGSVYLNEATFEKLVPLLRAQKYLAEVSEYRGEAVDCDLDVFRDSPVPVDRIGICRWYFHLFGVSADLSQPWLTVEPDERYARSIVVARSFRYRNLMFDYGFLNRFADVVFIGLPDEYDDFKKAVPKARHVAVGDFLEMAQIIRGAGLFIGNQSFPFSLAEGLKVPRVLEVDPGIPNVVPAGGEAYDVLFQAQFEHIVGKLLRDR